MGVMNVAQKIHIVPIMTETQKTSGFVSPHINMKLYEKVEFLIHFTAVANNDFTLTVTQSAVTAGSTPTAIVSRYRLTAVAATDTMEAIETLASTGLAITTSEDTLTLIVDVDSQDMTADSKPYVGLTWVDAASGDFTATIIALCWPKFPKETNSGALT